MLSPVAVKMLVLSLLSISWLLIGKNAMRLEENQPYHLAADRRDRRKARFYANSVWIGLAAAFLSFVSLEALGSESFDSAEIRTAALGMLRGIGFWGLSVCFLIWTQVASRVLQRNSDGASLIPTPEPHSTRNSTRGAR